MNNDITIYVKDLTGEIIKVSIDHTMDQQLVTDEHFFLNYMCELHPEKFPKNFTKLIRISENNGSFVNDEIVMLLVDLEEYYVEFPLILGIPRSFAAGIFQDIPNRLVRILEKNIPDTDIKGQYFMKIEWDTHEGFTKKGYIIQPKYL